MLHATFEQLRRSLMLSRFELPLRWQRHFGCSDRALPKAEVLDLVTIAFNNPVAVSEQWRLIAKNLRAPHCYTVIDNSSKRDSRVAIEALCKAQELGYIGLPPNPFSGHDPSMSHGVALNWAYRHFLKPRLATYFGLLDHDILPIKPTRVIPQLQRQGLYGLRQDRNDLWYLWPGYCFYSREWADAKRLDFRPQPGFDTGGANIRFYTQDPHKLQFADQAYPKDSNLEYIDGWIHVRSSGGWKDGANTDIAAAIAYAQKQIG